MKNMEIVSLGDYIEQIRGISYKPNEISEKPLEDYLPVLRATNFDEYGFKLGDLNYIHKSRIKKEQLIQAGDILIAASSGSKDIVGKNIQFKESLNGSFGAFCKLVRVKRDFNKDFIAHFFKTPYYRNIIRSSIQGANINNLKNEHINDLKIAKPPLEDQIHIANILSKAEAMISQRKESLRLLDEFLKSTFLEMFGDPVRNEKGWEKITLKEFGKIITGNTPPRNDDDNYSSNFIEWIKTDNIESDRLFVTNAIEYLSETGASKARFVEKGALLIACIAGSIESVGRAALTNRRVSFNQQINAIQPFEDISSFFLLWLFKISKLYIQNHATKGMKKILTKGDFEKIRMIKPPLKLQTQFAHIVEKTEALKVHYQTSLKELENLYGSLSQRAFRGELKVREELSMAAEDGSIYRNLKS